MTALALALTLLAAGDPAPPLPAYPDALRCAGLTEAAARAGKNAPQFSRLYDAALYWGLAASESARAAEVTGPAFKADSKAAADTAGAELAANDPKAVEALAKCTKAVPPV